MDGGGQHHGDLVEELHVVAEGHVEEPGPRAHQQVTHVGQGVPVRGGREGGSDQIRSAGQIHWPGHGHSPDSATYKSLVRQCLRFCSRNPTNMMQNVG